MSVLSLLKTAVNTKSVSDAAKKFSYNAVQDKGRRRPPAKTKAAERSVLNPRDHAKLRATTYDLVRNDLAAGWAYNKFLDHTTNFNFQVDHPDKDFCAALESAMADWSKKKNCDIARRMSLKEMIRTYGSGMCLDGDAMLIKLGEFKLQGIEADRIAVPSDKKIPEGYEINEQGLAVDEYGGVTEYCVCSRDKKTGKKLIFDKIYNENDVVFDGFFFRFDMDRGVSPFAAAINTFKDIAECDEAQLVKCKKQALYGLAFKSKVGLGGDPEITDPASEGYTPGEGETVPEKTEATTTTENEYPEVELDMGLNVQLDPGDDVDMFESKNPSAEYQAYIEAQLRRGFLCFNIPYTFYDSRKSSYVAMKQDRVEFKISVWPFMSKILAAYMEISEWIIPHLIDKYKIKLPKGLKIEQIKYEWIPSGEIWLDEEREVKAALMKVAGGLSDLPTEHRRRGTNFFDSLARQDKAVKEVKKTDILLYNANGQPLIYKEENNNG